MKKQQQTLFSDAGRQPRRGLLWFLFLVYLAAMTWIILFKFSISLDELPDIRKINFVPFGEMVIVNGQPDFSEVIMNGVIFLPFGIYLSALFPGGPFWKKFFAFAGVSLAYEICQYIFSIGYHRSDAQLSGRMRRRAGFCRHTAGRRQSQESRDFYHCSGGSLYGADGGASRRTGDL